MVRDRSRSTDGLGTSSGLDASRLPGPEATVSDNRLRGLLGLVLCLTLATSLFASVSARGLYQDGVYYLYRVAVSDWFHLVMSMRRTVDVLRQWPIVLLTRYTDLSLFARGQVFSFVMLMLPAVIVTCVWPVLPAGRKGWILFPLVYLLAGFGATSFNAIGEAAIATSIWWCLFFLLLLRTRALPSQILFLVSAGLATFMHEGTFPLMLLLLLICAGRWREAATRADRGFLITAALVIAGVLAYQMSWVIQPRVPADRAMVLEGLRTLEFVVRDGHVNFPLLAGALGCVVLGMLLAVRLRLAPDAAAMWTRRLVAGFCIACLLAIPLLSQDVMFAPGSQALARYQPVFLSFGLGCLVLALHRRGIALGAWLQPGVLVVVAALALLQASADVVATLHWQAYVADLRTRLSLARGLVPWNQTVESGDARKDEAWALMHLEWVAPLLSIVYADKGVVRAMIDPGPELTFRPVDPNKPDQLPNLRGIDFSPYRAAIASSAK